MKNHFHFLIKVKPEALLKEHLSKSKLKPNSGLHAPEAVVSKQFARLFSSFTQAINRANERTGSLIESPFKRKEINNDDYLTTIVLYIHQNPIKHRVTYDFFNFPHSS